MRPSPILAALLASALASLAPALARASACCGDGRGIGRHLADAERAGLSGSVRGAARVGSWSSTRDFTTPDTGTFDRELRAEIGWAVRASQRVEIGVVVPMLYTWKQAGELASSGGGAGDITASGRLELIAPSWSSWVPGTALTLSTLLPTGRGAQASTDLLGADATGLGAAEIRPGIAFEKTWEGWFATITASVGVRTAYVGPSGTEVHLAPRWQILAAGGPVWSSGFSISVGALHEREAGPAMDGAAAPDSATRERTAVLLFAGYDFATRWTAIASSQIDVPLGGIGRNESAQIALSLGLLRTWGLHD